MMNLRAWASFSSRRRLASVTSRRCSTPRATITGSSPAVNGLGMKSYAPPFIDSTAVLTVAKPVITITPMSGSVRLTRSLTSIPPIPGILRSTTSSPAPTSAMRWSPGGPSA